MINEMLVIVTGLLPWNAVPGKACGMTLSNVCKTREVRDQEVNHVLTRNKVDPLSPLNANLLLSVPNDLRPLHRCLRRSGHHSVGSGEWLRFSRGQFYSTSSAAGYNNSVLAHVTKWRSECGRRGISGLHDWWCLHYRPLFVFLGW